MSNPTTRTLEALRNHGWLADKVEQRLPIPFKPGMAPKMFNVTRDAFGFGDILACHLQEGILLVQATSRSNVNARITKVTAIDVEGKHGARPNPVRLALRTWLHAGGRFEVWGWSKGNVRGETRVRWRVRRVIFGYSTDNASPLGWQEGTWPPS